MQKVVNAIALLSGVVSLSIVGGGFYLYTNADVMIEEVRGKIVEEISDSLPTLITEMMPAIPIVPPVTGPPMSF